MQKPLKILHTLSLHRFGGPAEAVLRLAKAQLCAGHEVRLALDTFRDGDLRKKAEEFDIPIDDRFVLCQKAGSIFHMRDVLTFKKIWMESSADIIHCHSSHDHTLAAIARPVKTSTRLVRSIFNNRVFDAKHAWQLRRADAMLVMDDATRKNLQERGLIDQWRIFLVSRAVDPNVFRRGKGGDKVLQNAGIAPNSLLVGLVFRNEDIGDVMAFVDDWKTIHDTLGNACMLLIHLRQRDTLDASINAKLSGIKSVRCLHLEKCKPEIHRAFMVELFLPFDGCGDGFQEQLALEAMATAIPVVVAKDGPTAKLIFGQSGRVVDFDNLGYVKDVLVELLSDEQKAYSMGSEARHEATRENAMDRQEQGLEEFYRTIIADSI